MQPPNRRDRTLRTAIAAAVCGGLLLAGCTSDAGSADDATGSGSSSSAGGDRGGSDGAGATSSSAAPAATTPPTYAGQAGAFDAGVAKRLGRSTVPDAEVAGPTGTTGTWKGTRIGVVASGDDATLVVRDGSAWRIVGGWWPSKDLPGPYLGGRQHVLVLGSDARQGQSIERSRADTIQLIGLDGRGGGGILGIPRDSYLPLSTGGSGKVNGAMPRGGPAAMRQTLADATDLPIKGWMLTDFVGFQRAVQALGGIPITLPRPVGDLEAGEQTLDGKQALFLARERKSLPRGDFDRSSNQGLLLMAGLTQLRTKGVTELPKILSTIDPHVKTSLTPEQVLTFVGSAYAVNPSRVGREVASGSPATIGGASVVRLSPEAKQTFERFADGNL